MKRVMGSVVGAALVVGVLTVAGAQGPKDATFVDSKKANFKEVVPGVKKVVLWGDHDAGRTARSPGSRRVSRTRCTRTAATCEWSYCAALTSTSRRTARSGG